MRLRDRIYLIYDGRARYGNTDNALVMEVCTSLADAQWNRTEYGKDCVIYSYKLSDKCLTDERREADK